MGAAECGKTREPGHGNIIPGDDHLCDGMFLEDALQRVERPEHAIAINLNPLILFIIVDETDERKVQTGVMDNFS